MAIVTDNPAFPREVYDQRFVVPFDYPVVFTRGVLDPRNPALAETIDRRREGRRHRVLAFVDSGVVVATPEVLQRLDAYVAAHGGVLALAAPPAVVAGGEHAKTSWDGALAVVAAIGGARLCRQSVVLAVGGGSVLDMVGFAASLVHRGVRLVRLPSTVLSQNDAGIGVKNGLNDRAAKNFLGAFAPPFAVVNDLDFLDTLTDRDWHGGIAEAFKVAIIKDAAFFDFLCAHADRLRTRDRADMETLVRRCARLHLDHIRTSGDPFEFGSARPLDFGHWSAHWLEMATGGRLGHGQAVSIGVAVDSAYAMGNRLLSAAELERILAGLVAAGLPVWTAELDRLDSEGHPAVLAGLEQFREHLGGDLSLCLPRSLGGLCQVGEVEHALVVEALAFVKAYHQGHVAA